MNERDAYKPEDVLEDKRSRPRRVANISLARTGAEAEDAERQRVAESQKSASLLKKVRDKLLYGKNVETIKRAEQVFAGNRAGEEAIREELVGRYKRDRSNSDEARKSLNYGWTERYGRDGLSKGVALEVADAESEAIESVKAKYPGIKESEIERTTGRKVAEEKIESIVDEKVDQAARRNAEEIIRETKI